MQEAVVTGDLDKDSYDEILVVTRTTYSTNPCRCFIIKRDGTIAKVIDLQNNACSAAPSLGDFNNDGFLEICIPELRRVNLFDHTGNAMPNFPVNLPDIPPGGFSPKILRQVAIADINNDNQVDIVFGAGGTEELLFLTGDPGSNGGVWAIGLDGEFIDLNPDPEVFPMYKEAPYMLKTLAPSIDDIDNDGKLDLLVTNISEMSWETKHVPSWQDKSRNSIYAYDLNIPYNQNTRAWPMPQHDPQRTGRYIDPRILPAPANFTGTAAAADKINYTWDDLDNENGYRIYKTPNTNVSGDLPANQTGWTYESLEPNTVYECYVKGFNDFGESPPSSVAQVATLALLPSDLSVDTVTNNSVSLSWDGRGGSSYEIVCALNSNFDPLVETIQTANEQATFDNLSSKTEYWFKLRAFNHDQIPTDWTQAVSAQTLESAPAAPQNFTGQASSISQIEWQWDDVNNEDGYRVYKIPDINISGDIAANQTSWTYDNLDPNTRYTCFVRSFNQAGESPDSDHTAVYTQAQTPTNLVAGTVTNNSVELSWNGYNSTKFEIYCSEYPDFNSVFKTDTVYQSQTVFEGLKGETLFYFKVRAYNGDDIPTASFSNVVHATTLPDAIPMIQVVSPNGGEIWSNTEIIRWIGSDPDSNNLDTALYYQKSIGSWTLIDEKQYPGSIGWDLESQQYAGITTGENSVPVFCDIDADGDHDLFIGTKEGRIIFYKNTGSEQEASWELETLFFAGVNTSGGESKPMFCDIDADGDYDLFVGCGQGTLYYLKNKGTAQEALFVFETDRYNQINVLKNSAPVFNDIDGDNDFDLVIGMYAGSIYCYRNDGDAQQPIWTLDTGLFAGVTGGLYCTPVLNDMDKDQDLDLLVGDTFGKISYYRNDGTKYIPDWVLVTRSFEDINTETYAAPSFCDIDGDKDDDLFIGRGTGSIISFERNLIRQYAWDTTTAGGNSSNYKIKVSISDGSSLIEDASDDYFTINNIIKVPGEGFEVKIIPESPNTLKLTWDDDPNGEGYEVFLNGSSVSSVLEPGTISYSINELEPNTAYAVSVTIHHQTQPFVSPQQTVYTQAVKPSQIQVNALDEQTLAVSWSGGIASRYEVEVDDSKDFADPIARIELTHKNAQIGSLKAAQAYYV
ncbi:MAG: hypothetical protein GF384_07825, partial [Elusimicrobia bacterium]|nr:hypothetical protein [Elusimicrobiota bacterium]